MRLVSLTLTGYRQFLEPTTLHIPTGLTGICGPNGVGKSKLIEAIGYALYGWQRRLMPQGDRLADLPALGGHGPGPRVELVLELWGEQYEIVRERREALIRAHGAVDPLAATPSAVTAKVIELLGLPPAAYSRTFVARQREIAGLQALGPDPRRRLVNRLIGIAQVEAAIALAQGERTTRAASLQAAIDLGGPSAEEASARLEETKRDHAVAAAVAAKRAETLAAAQSRVKAAQATSAALRGRADQASALRDRVTELDSHRATLEENLGAARGRVARSTAAKEEVATAGAVLRDTEWAAATLERQRALAAIAALRAEREAIEHDLADRLVPLSRERSDLQAALLDDDEALRALNEELAAHAGARSAGEAEARRFEEEADRLDDRARAARALGPDGVCDVCGQAYGPNLERALVHLVAEATAARAQAQEVRTQVREAQARENAVRRRIGEREAERDHRRVRLGTYDEVPGEEAWARERRREIETKLEATPSELLVTNYDAAAEQAATAAVARRAQAELDVARLVARADELDAALVEEREAERALGNLARRREGLEAEIARLEPAPTEVAAADGELGSAETALAGAITSEREARDRAAALATRVELDRATLERAVAWAGQIASARGALLVSERTAEVLRRLLEEITAEARPRLVDMLDGWLRALLSARFRGVRLTDDYRIEADNGSGWHGIGHFSGGEQTLLALMLRVAISLFCQERAGFDRGFLILDEVFGDQDGEHRALLVQFLGEIKEHYHQVLVVNHVDDVTAMLDSIIDVQPVTDNTSTAILRN